MTTPGWPAVVAIVHDLKVETRIQQRGCEDWPARGWSKFLIVPTTGYLESENGPITYHDVISLEIRTVRETARGRLIAPLIEDMRVPLISALDAIRMPYRLERDRIRIPGDPE